MPEKGITSPSTNVAGGRGERIVATGGSEPTVTVTLADVVTWPSLTSSVAMKEPFAV